MIHSANIQLDVITINVCLTQSFHAVEMIVVDLISIVNDSFLILIDKIKVSHCD